MSDFDVRSTLWEWLGELDDPDPEQQSWKRAFAAGMLDAVDTAGLLAPDERAHFRALLDGADVPAPAGTDPAAAIAHVDALRASLTQLRRAHDPATLPPSWRHDGAIEALAAAGVLSGDEVAALRETALAVAAPWLSPAEIDELVAHDGIYALAVPAETEEEEREDAAQEAEAERAQRRGPVRRVLTVQAPRRADGLVVLAAVLREDVVDVRFQHVGAIEHQEASSLDRTFDAPAPPALADDRGTPYAPAAPRLVQGHRSSRKGPDGPLQVTTGIWRYLPAAPPEAMTFVATVGPASWTLA